MRVISGSWTVSGFGLDMKSPVTIIGWKNVKYVHKQYLFNHTLFTFSLKIENIQFYQKA